MMSYARVKLESRTRGTRLACWPILWLLTSCGSDAELDARMPIGLPGLYVPGSTLGASDPTDMPVKKPIVSDRCRAFVVPAADGGTDGDGQTPTAGTLRVQYSTQSLAGDFAPKNCGAAWIESADGRYVSTLEIRAVLRRAALVYLQEHVCEDQLGPDVISEATTSNHDKAHMLSWSGTDFTGQLVPDGTYQLMIESTETDKAPGELVSFAFDKTAIATSLQPDLTADGPLSALTLTWRPSPEAQRGR